jgi:hypothetical protein
MAMPLRAEGDEMPSESEFVASLKGMKGTPKVPQLEASEAQLANTLHAITPKPSRLRPICRPPPPAIHRWNRVKHQNRLFPACRKRWMLSL